MEALKSIIKTLLTAICCCSLSFGILIINYCVVLSLIIFGTAKQDCATRTGLIKFCSERVWFWH